MATVSERTESSLLPAYVSYGTVKNFAERMKASGIPGRIDKTVMTGMAGGNPRAPYVVPAVPEACDGPNGEPTDAFESLVAAAKEDSWRAALSEVIDSAYADILNGLDLKTATIGQLEEQFRDIGKATGTTLDKCIRFFLPAAKEAGMDLSSHLSHVRKPRVPRTKTGRVTTGVAAAVEIDDIDNDDDDVPDDGEMLAYPVFFKGKTAGKIVFPADITLEDCKMFTITLQLIEAFAKQQVPAEEG